MCLHVRTSTITDLQCKGAHVLVLVHIMALRVCTSVHQQCHCKGLFTMRVGGMVTLSRNILKSHMYMHNIMIGTLYMYIHNYDIHMHTCTCSCEDTEVCPDSTRRDERELTCSQGTFMQSSV